MTSPTRRGSPRPEQISLVDLLDRLLSSGVVVTGEVTLSIADIDLVTISLRALLASASTVLWETDQEISPHEEAPLRDKEGELFHLPGIEGR